MKHYHSIQYLRALAAVLVLIFHFGVVGRQWRFVDGNAGVDIFFVISGFVMYLAGRSQRPGEFLKHRLARIIPLYWAATLVAAAVGRRYDGIPAAELPLSLLFIAYPNPGATPAVSPVLSVGWTLNLEMMFYLLFAAGLAASPRHILTFVVAGLVLLVVAGSLAPVDWPVAQFYTRGLLLEFAAGIMLGWLVLGGRLRLPPLLAIALMIAGFVTLLLVPMTIPRVVRWGIPAVAMVSGAVALEPWIALRPSRLLGLLGASSYALYLSHTLIIGSLARLLHPLRNSHGPLFALAGIMACLTIGVAIHLLYEKPLHRLLRARLSRPASASG